MSPMFIRFDVDCDGESDGFRFGAIVTEYLEEGEVGIEMSAEWCGESWTGVKG